MPHTRNNPSSEPLLSGLSKNNIIGTRKKNQYVWITLVFAHDLGDRIFSRRPLAPEEVHVFKTKKLANEFKEEHEYNKDYFERNVHLHRMLVKTNIKSSKGGGDLVQDRSVGLFGNPSFCPCP